VPPRYTDAVASDVRSIVAEGIAYRYVIAAVDASYIRLTVWPAAERGKTLGRVRVRFDDPWINYGPILGAAHAGRDPGEIFELRPLTPSVVATIVRALVAEPGAQRDFEWRDGLVR
jgi:hypothetical protein